MAANDRVLIAGAGPVGLSCALFLTRAGIPVSVFEAESELPEDMRASTFHPATLDLLDDAEVVADLLADGVICRQWQYRNHETGECAVFDMVRILRGLSLAMPRRAPARAARAPDHRSGARVCQSVACW